VRILARAGGSAVAASVVAAVVALPAWADGSNGVNTAGSQEASTWSFARTAGVFAGIPILASLLIVGLVLAGPILRSGRRGSGVAAFSGPHAGAVDGTDDPSRTGDFAGHRAPAETGSLDAEDAEAHLAAGAANGETPDQASPRGSVTDTLSTPAPRRDGSDERSGGSPGAGRPSGAGAARGPGDAAGQGGAGARW